MSLVAASSIHGRGDENNSDVGGRVGGCAVFDLDTRYDHSRGVSIFGRIGDAFNRTCANFGVLGDNVFTDPGQSFEGANPRAELSRSHRVPRSIRVGLHAGLRSRAHQNYTARVQSRAISDPGKTDNHAVALRQASVAPTAKRRGATSATGASGLMNMNWMTRR
jgi:hypothetical protein